MHHISSLRVCLVTQQLGRVLSGPGIYARNLLNHLLQDGHEVTVLTLKDQWLEEKGGYRFIGVDQKFFTKSQARWIELSLAFRRILHELEQKERFDLIHFTDTRDSFFCAAQSPRIGNVNDPYSAELKSLSYYRIYYYDWFMRWAYYRIVHYIERIFLKRLDAIISNSFYTARKVIEAYPHTAAKLHTVYKSVELSQFESALQYRQKRKYSGTNSILMVGSNLQRKGLGTLIQAAPDIVRSLPGIHFKIAGNDPLERRFREKCEQLRVVEHFDFLGNQSREELVKLYARAGILVLPALTEALGVVLLEAMASGLPVIGSNVGGIPEIISDRENGLLVPPDSPRSLAEAIIHLAKNKELQMSLALAGLDTAKHFSVETMMKNTYQVYNQLLTQKGSISH